MDERALRELELLPVIRLYALHADPAPLAEHAPAQELSLLASEGAGSSATWIFAGMGPRTGDAESTLLEGMMAAVGCQSAREVDGAEIDRLKPRVIVVLGEAAARALLGVQGTVASLRGRTHDYRGVPAIVTYPPDHLLHSLPDKASAWEDLVLARRKAASA